jgi:histidine triad (HIT) family protein
MSVCVFCQIVQGQAPATVVETWPDAIAFVPLEPVVEEEYGHVLVVPRVHVRDFTVDPEVTAATVRRAAELAAKLGVDEADGQGLNMISSAGKAATQTVFHLHVHVLIRRTQDKLHLPWTGQIKKG